MSAPTATRSPIAVLRATIKLFHEGAGLYLSDDPRAERARLRLAKAGSRSAAFYAQLSEDLHQLDEVIECIPDTWPGDGGKGDDAVSLLLTLLRDQYLRKEGRPESDRYQELMSLYRDSMDPKHNASQDRLSWFVLNMKLDETSKSMRKQLLPAIRSCLEELLAYGNSTNGPQAESTADIQIPSKPLHHTVFDMALSLHKAIDQGLCQCHFEHDVSPCYAWFSFEGPRSDEQESLSGTICIRTLASETWKTARYLYHSLDSKHDDKASTQGVAVNLNDFCHAVQTIASGGKIESTTLHEPSDTSTIVLSTSTQDVSLTPCFELRDNHGILKMSQPRRLMLALYLSYAYLHLGGGEWWPYHQRSSVMLPSSPESNGHIPLPLFRAPLNARAQVEAEDDKFDEFIILLNDEMPSLVAFAKLLLELFLGYSIPKVGDIKEQLDHCADQALGTYMNKAVRTCLMMNASERGHYARGGTIHDSERLRMRFTNEVILPIQWILETAYEINTQDILRPPPVIPETVQAPVSPVRPNGIETVRQGYCLDDGEQQQIPYDQLLSHAADQYMNKLQNCNSEVFRQDSRADSNSEPIRIAILDTGADIPSDLLYGEYAERLVDIRSWLNTTSKNGRQLSSTGLDSDGHGTHGTSVLLQATRYTNIKVYVAQIFAGREQRLEDDVRIGNMTVWRIVNAIRYAVHEWKVDVISMSFGCPEENSEISEAIREAEAHHVLMLAAASNGGTFTQRSWPAKDYRVLCVYAANGAGQAYAWNPRARADQSNFAVLGCVVEACWPASPTEHGKVINVRKSGTSTATPICAAITGLTISICRRYQKHFISIQVDEGRDAHSAKSDYRTKLQHLQRAQGMTKVLRCMLDLGSKSNDGFDYITPSLLFKKNRPGHRIVETIMEALDS